MYVFRQSTKREKKLCLDERSVNERMYVLFRLLYYVRDVLEMEDKNWMWFTEEIINQKKLNNGT